MPANSRKINLLPPSEFELSFWGRFLRWAVTTGRYIIIVTELIVILAFLSRFKLDNDIANLNSAIEGKKNVLQANSAAEKQFRIIQMRMEAVTSLLSNRSQQGKVLDELVEYLPAEIKFDSIESKSSGVVLSATTVSENSLGIYLAKLFRSGTWRSVSVTQLEADQTKGIKFTLELTNK